ncbi:MAG: murein biosynthesis integral membrane protein MurJ, partial [Candidatus Dadabacteria bacterium]|nr:murein biosynthesis integral membrane protein MurJ [Candidatus Dadabacteria bacterium]
MKQQEEITRSAGVVGSLTFLSRIAGYARDVVIAYFFGASALTDAFWVAFRIPNLLRRLFAEGSLTISFIPVFTQYLETKNKEEAKKVADAVFTILIFLLIIISIGGILLSPYIIKLFAAGFDKNTFDLAVSLNRIMFPYILFISLTALSMGVLNSLRHFFAPAFSPVILNLCIIIAVFLIYNSFNIPIYAAAVGVIVGGVLQLLFVLPFLNRRGFLFGFSKHVRHPAVKRIGFLIIPQLFGVAVYNLNILVNTQYASFMTQGTISYLYFAERLIEFPLGIIAVSIATVLLPSLSSYVSKKEFDKFRETYSFTLRLMFFILIPALVGLIVLRVPICNLLYQRGEFDYAATIFTSQALLGYAVGLWAVGGIRITAPAFYSMQDTRTPVIIAFVAFIVNAVFGYVLGFTFDLKHTGLAFASS